MSTLPNHLEPSKLGTKSYWDQCYDRELSNHTENPDDEGTIWFSDSGAEEKVIDFLERLVDEGTLTKGEVGSVQPDAHATSFLDLGTGNGHTLFALRKEEWSGQMLGLDYSESSIQLAKKIELTRQSSRPDDADEDAEESHAPIEFQVHDLLSPSPLSVSAFDVLLDKGTFDAISLSSKVDANGRRTSEQYRFKIKPFLKNGGLFIITSCNWTEQELRTWFETVNSDEDSQFVFSDRIQYPSFRFGGQEGQTVVTLCFKKIS